MEYAKKNNMPYRYLGNTGMKVSVLGYGNWVNSNDEKSYELTRDAIKKCYEAGVNFFDTAEIYGDGVAETVMGKAFQELGYNRKDYVVSTKLMKLGSGPNDRMLSRKHIIEGARNCLKRLQMDYVDVIFCHRPDYQTPLEETCRAMSWLIDQNMAFYWGTSEWSAARIQQAIGICEKLNLHKPIVEQPQYSLLCRDNFEKTLADTFSQHGYGSTIWSPIAMGLLSGKYNDGTIPDGSRFAETPYLMSFFKKYFGDDAKEETCKKFVAFADLAKENGFSMAQFALGWAIANKDVSTALMGFSKIEQIDDNLGALNVLAKWNQDLEDKVEAIFKNRPDPGMNARTWSNFTPRRQIQLQKQ
mmetsp:Transcript_38728/g.28073  ORF Transcript_38728/g.28073 Transcript_38728/m.28073 type:complete len:358 (-) Transcript_38728:59-1132(-)|eukprot:CAMPEP_0116877610 /NCGR_PEP_ID=MMETSP0463-20121206/9375_1 /TAXON_ID=181622 /ORGANISM="Strombidinopsis sp, Strain SopsisLIS2011" /LENGTH=357 /DNA_ID=CAMNT_0004525033 /DNA_START=43 /DNA_END=1116 /DNA_ORIENTATION=-